MPVAISDFDYSIHISIGTLKNWQDFSYNLIHSICSLISLFCPDHYVACSTVGNADLDLDPCPSFGWKLGWLTRHVCVCIEGECLPVTWAGHSLSFW